MSNLKVEKLSKFDKPGNKAVDRTLTVKMKWEDGTEEEVTTNCCTNPPGCNPLLDPLCT